MDSLPSDNPFTQYYGQLLHQGNMLQDHIRTGAYQHAFLRNESDFRDKVVLDVGTGSGLLAFFAVQAGARKVYAVEASDAAEVARALVKANNMEDKIVIVRGKVEEVDLPEKVDIIVSEPIGCLLVHERMLESYAAARLRFLKPGGLMFPTTGSIVLAPITDDVLYKEQLAKIEFWKNSNFYGIDMTAALPTAQQEYFSQPVVGFFPSSSIISQHRTVHTIDFSAILPNELQNFHIEFAFQMDQTAIMHGLGCWFDINFIGNTVNVLLSTSPDSPGTHW
jgi:histone-arginine methyltransferase CARM1